MAVNEVKLNYDLISEVYQKLGAIVSTLHDTALQVKIIQGVLHGDDWLTNAFQDDTMQAMDSVVETQRALRLKLEKYRQLINEASQELYQMDLVKGKQRSNIAIKDLSLIGWSVISSIIGIIIGKKDTSSEIVESVNDSKQTPEVVIISESADPQYIVDPASELDIIKNEMHEPNRSTGWNIAKDHTNSISCWWFSNKKLSLRGIDKSAPVFSSNDYSEWKLSNESSKTGFTNTSAEYIKYLLTEKNNGEPLYNIYIEGDTQGNSATHTMLIDKAYMDNGELRMIFSDNRNGKAETFTPIGANPDGIEKAWPILDPINVSEVEFINGYSDATSSWAVSYAKKPNKIVCYGL